MNTIKPEQALEQYIGEQFIEWVSNYIPEEMNSWPIMNKIRQAHPKPEKSRKFAIQMFLAHEAFLGSREGDPGFLRFAIANLSESDDPQAETALEILEKRRTDELIGHKVERGILQTQKREQWVRLLRALEISDEEIDKTEPKEPTRNYVAELSDVFSTMDWQTAMGAFAALECSLTELYKVFTEFLKSNFSLSEKELEVLNTQAMQNSYAVSASHILDKIVFDNEAKELVWQGVSKQLEIQKEFLSGMEKYLEN
jgi:pyrroloquinoline quinone (PQQ) biosynthesis protein C